MVGCEAVGCKNRSEKGFKFYGFPRQEERKKKWLHMVGRKDLIIKVTRWNYKKLCEAHFEADQFELSKKGRKRLRKDAVPTLFDHRRPPKRRKAPTPRAPPEPPPAALRTLHWEHTYTAKPDTEIVRKKADKKRGEREKTQHNCTAKPGTEIRSKKADDERGEREEMPREPRVETCISSKDRRAAERMETGIPSMDRQTAERAKTCVPSEDRQTAERAKTGIPSDDRQTAEREAPVITLLQLSPSQYAAWCIGQQTTLIDCGQRRGMQPKEEQRWDMQPEESSTIEDLRRELRKEQMAAQKAQNHVQRIKRSLRLARKQNYSLKKQMKNIVEKLSTVFSKDQVKALGRNTKGMQWSNDTIEKALKIRFAVGRTGYQALQKLQYPLPGLRTLMRRLRSVKFEPGVLEDVFALLEMKAAAMSELERECVLTLDEMALTPGVGHLPWNSSGPLYGDVTLPGHTGPATHACVFMLAGTSTQWKQVVAYHYTGNETQGTVYEPIMREIIHKATAIGLHVVSVTTDMGTSSQEMWRAFGVDHSNTSVPHPVAPDRQLYFMPDVPNVIQYLRDALVRGHTLTIPDDVVDKENLPYNKVSLQPVKDLINFQEGMALKIAPNLSRQSIEPAHFEKVEDDLYGMNVFSQSTTAGIKHMVQKEGRPYSYLTTAWFLEQVNHWFDVMSSRHNITALSHLKMEEYEKAVAFLNGIVDLFGKIQMESGTPGDWNPIQAGVIMVTRSILAIQEVMLARGHKFVLTARFTQDCVENVVSCVRDGNAAPTPVEFQKALRLICLGSFSLESLHPFQEIKEMTKKEVKAKRSKISIERERALKARTNGQPKERKKRVRKARTDGQPKEKKKRVRKARTEGQPKEKKKRVRKARTEGQPKEKEKRVPKGRTDGQPKDHEIFEALAALHGSIQFSGSGSGQSQEITYVID